MTVTVAALKTLEIQIPNDVTDGNLQVFCDTAALIRSEDLSGVGLSDDRLDKVELYLAAHFACLTYENGGLTSKRIANSGESYLALGAYKQGLPSTRFGQAALSLDSSGTLQATMNANKARFGVVRSAQPAAPGYEC